ncbi:MAG: DNA mismatch repair protein MutS [Eubacterium sp.]|nr:DNA mismatch repair protein MutS [Eubacterium sp.]MDE6766768.1 DNA mismatch repair protein MutS [Eubacterium sp.]
MMVQYFQIKAQYGDTILFFRLGDFYEMFFDDAKIASRELDLVLTGRDCGQEERAPMCGVPFHSADGYIAKLVSRGYKVAICEQMENPAEVKGLVKRDVIRIITPGTVIEGNMLEDGVNNYLCSVFGSDKDLGLCFADVSTGEFHITVLDGDDIQNKLINQLSTYAPKELIINAKALDLDRLESFAKRLNASVEVLDDECFDFDASTQLIIETLKKDEISSLGIGHSKSAVSALGAVIGYLKKTQKKNEIEVPSEIDFYDDEQYMSLDISARRNLELTKSMMTGDKKHSLLWVIDKTKTAMGKRMIKSWIERPLMSIPKIVKRQNAVGEFVDNPMLRDGIREALTGVNDIERLMTRIVYGTANAKELKSLQFTIEKLPELKGLLSGTSTALLKEIFNGVDLLEDVRSLIDSAIVDEPPFSVREGGLIKAGYNEEIDSLKAIMTDGAGVIASIENEQRELTGIPKLKVGYNRVFGYYIEVSNSYRDMVPETYIRKQTLANCERFITQELKELEGRIIGAKDRSIALEYEVFSQVRNTISEEIQRLQRTAKSLAVLDVLASLAQVAVNNNYTCPVISNDGVIDIKDGRHPVVEALLDGAPFVPNDTILDKDDNRCAIITGPNMAGKSTYMRQIALITLLAQVGSFVPARIAKIGIVDAIFTRVGASDDLATGQSTFMVEMNEVATILKNATSSSLIILDEIGRGTSTFDGMSIARAVLEFVCKKKSLGAKSLFATHYHELTAMEGMIDGVKNYSIAVKKRGDDITFLRRIVLGGADQSFGIEVAKLAGVPDSVVKRAKVILKELESNAVPIEFKAEDGIVEEEENDIQYNFTANGRQEIFEILKTVDVNTLTPIEAMQTLYDLKKKAQELS